MHLTLVITTLKKCKIYIFLFLYRNKYPRIAYNTNTVTNGIGNINTCASWCRSVGIYIYPYIRALYYPKMHAFYPLQLLLIYTSRN